MNTLKVILIIAMSNIWGWGFLGHKTIAKISKKHLTPTTLSELKHLQNQDSLEQLSIWPDTIRLYYPKTTKWHYTVILTPGAMPKNEQGLIYPSLCKNIKLLNSPNDHWQNKHRALSWVIHLVGDMHQPLHIGNGKDLGGNQYYVKWYKRKKPISLHKIWDNYLVKYALRINPNLTYTKISQQRINSSPLEWMQESRALHQFIYPASTMTKLNDPYAKKMSPVVIQQINLAAARLAYILNYIFDPEFRTNNPSSKAIAACKALH